MKLRPVLLVLVLLSGFYYLTTHVGSTGAMQPWRQRARRPHMRRQVVEAREQNKNKQNWAEFHGVRPISFNGRRCLLYIAIVSRYAPSSLPVPQPSEPAEIRVPGAPSFALYAKGGVSRKARSAFNSPPQPSE